MAELSDVAYARVAALLAGEFVIERELGRGGMGAVLLAHETRLERRVAVKVLLPGTLTDPESRERLLREARTAAQLSHPNVVPILRVIEAGEDTILILGFVEGETIAEYVRTRGPVQPKECARILRDVAWALGYAHARGIIHRDIKPDNIMIERGTGRAMVMDFGISQREGVRSLTETGQLVGSVHYVSPERAQGETASPASDLYALGVTAYFMLSGILPIDGPSVATVLVRHLTEVPRPLSSVRDDIPNSLDNAIMRCLAKTPGDRFPTAEAFAEEMHRIVGAPTDIPPMLRGWIMRGEMLRWVVLLWILPLIVMPNAEILKKFEMGGPTNFATLVGLRIVVVMIGLPMTFLACFLVRLRDVRLAHRAGFSIDDIRHALNAWSRQRIEEAVVVKGHPSVTGRAVRGLGAVVAFAATVVCLATLMQPAVMMREHGSAIMSPSVVTSSLIGALLGIAYLAHLLNVDVWLRSLRRRFWRGGGGAAMSRLAVRWQRERRTSRGVTSDAPETTVKLDASQ